MLTLYSISDISSFITTSSILTGSSTIGSSLTAGSAGCSSSTAFEIFFFGDFSFCDVLGDDLILNLIFFFAWTSSVLESFSGGSLIVESS